MKKVHETFDQGRLNFLKRRFFNYKAGANEIINEMASNLSRLQMTIRDIKGTETSTDLDVALTLINSVKGEAYIMVKYHLEEMENLILTHTKERLKLVKQRIKDDLISDELVNRAKDTSKGKNFKETRECYYCKKKGHLKTKCFKWLATNEGKKFTEKQAKKTDQDDNIKPTNPRGTKSGRKQPDRPAAGARKAEEGNDSGSNEAFMAIEEIVNSFKGWIIDSGASRHMTSDESIFVTKRGISSTVTIANDEALKARAIGDVQIDLRERFVIMKKVLLMLGLNANLLSISALNRRGLTVLFTKSGVEIRRKDTLIATGIARGRMYLLRTAVTALYITEGEEASDSENSVGAIAKPMSFEKIPQSPNQKTDVFKLWHERLRHVSPFRMKLLTDQVVGMKAMEFHDQLTCDVCDLTKLIRKINRASPKRAFRRLGKIHTDV